jgi:glycerol-3-phosphate O-acyltransferase / dihydroxyacetone phosphate acyltransferase
MLYSFLKLLMRTTTRIFFRSITIRNSEAIPKEGPLLVLANHPSTFLDPIVIASLLDRNVFFLAKGELFKSGFAKWFFPKLNMIPVYRKQDDPTQMSKNQDTFKKCFEHLEKGGAILMFPEGISITERKLRPIKTGAARIVLGAEANNDFKLNTNIITIGLNYENPHRFNQQLFVNIDDPIKVETYKNEYATDSFKTAESLTEEIRIRLEKLIIAIEDEKTDELVKHIEVLYKYKLSQDNSFAPDDQVADFTLTKNILESVTYFLIHQPERVESMRSRIDNYFNKLSILGIQDIDIAKNKTNQHFFGSNLKAILFIILGFPFYIYGLINNYLPFEIPGWIANKVSKSIEFRGPIGMVGGMFTFIIFYTLQLMLVWHYSHHQLLTLLYGLSLPLSGIFTYWYYHRVTKIRNKWNILLLFYKKSVFVSNLITERELLIEEFDKAKEEYLALQQNE